MSNFINRLFLIVVNVVLVVLLISQFDNNSTIAMNNINAHKIKLASDIDSLDILFVGNSYCYSSFDSPHVNSTGLKSFNLGIATAGPQFISMIVNDYLSRTSIPPKFMGVLIDPMLFSNLSDNYSNFPLHRFLSDPISNIDMEIIYGDKFNIIESYRTSMKFALNSLYIVLKGTSYTQSKIFDENRGFMPSNDIYLSSEKRKSHDIYSILRDSKIRQNDVQMFNETLARIEESGSKVILIKLPKTPIYNYYNEDYLIDYQNYEDLLLSKFEHIIIPKDIITNSDYRDIDHMNSSGAIKTTHFILQYFDEYLN